MLRLKSHYPTWLLALSATQGGAVLVFMSFSGALPLIQAEWGLSNVEAGAIQSAGQVGYLLAVLLISSLTDYVGSKRLIVGGALWAGISNLLFAGLAFNTTSAIILRALVGLGIAGIYMPGLKLISQKIPREQRGRAVGFFVASFTLGAAFSIALGGNLASVMGWRFAFGAITIGPILGALISWRYLPETVKPDTLAEQPRQIKELLTNRQALAVILLYVCHAWEVLGLRSWLTTFLTAVRMNAGVDLIEATRSGATIAGVATVIAAVATASVGAISDRINRIKVIIVVMALGSISTLLLGISLTLPWIVVVLIAFSASFLSNADSAVISTHLTEVVPYEYLGRTLAIYSFMGFTAGSISPLVFGAALDYTGTFSSLSFVSPWTWAFATFAIASLLGLVVAVNLQRKTSRFEPGVSLT